MKKFISLLITVLFIVSSFDVVLANGGQGTFEDVTSDHYAFDAVEYFYSRNVINGVGNNKYEPDAFITREQFAKMISIIYSKENFESKEQTFSDVSKDMWSFKYIESVKEYLTGYYPEGGEAFFNPHGKATREDIAYALVKIGGLQKYTDLSVLDKYEDNQQISVNLREYIAAAVNSGLIQGYNNLLRPQDGCTRAEVAELLFRAIKKPVSEYTEIKQEEKNDNVIEKVNKIVTDEILSISGYGEDEIEGKIVLEWSVDNETADFSADLKCKNGGFDYVRCEIKLINVTEVEENSITGVFDVWLDGNMRHDNINGTITIDDELMKLNTEEYDYKLIAEFDRDNKSYNDNDDDMKYDNNTDEKPDAAENVIYASDITEFKIINTGDENLDIDDEDRLNGTARMVFGEDGIEDTKLIVNITVDGKDEYRIESTAIDRYSPTSKSVLLELNYDVYKNDRLIIENGGYRAYVHKEDDEMFLNGRAHFIAEDITWLSGDLPKEPEEQPYELWADASVISYWVMDNDVDAGYLNYTYKTEKKISKIESKFTLSEDVYSIELVREISKKGGELTGIFNIICNGKTIAENAVGKITGYNGKVGSAARLELADSTFGIDLKIIEISY